LPILLSFAYLSEKKWERRVMHATHAFGLWLLVMSASRTPFAAYGLAILFIITLVSSREKTWLKKIGSFIKKSIGMGFLIMIMMLSFGQDMYERFFQVVESYPQIYEKYEVVEKTFNSINGQRKIYRDDLYSWLGIIKIAPPENSIGFDNSDIAPVLVPTDEVPTTIRPSDVYKDIPDLVKVTTTSADGITTTSIVEKERTWSDNALKYGLSLGIRLDTLWPNAIKGFMKNPLLGSGYATLNKETTFHFLEADSTDNNFLRVLGETGLLGFITFFGIIIATLQQTWQHIHDKKVFRAAIAIGLFSSSIGLLANATYIDVYAASKVAFTYWGLVGFALTVLAMPTDKKLRLKKK